MCVQAAGFSLLGPFEAWQTPALGYNPLGNDLGAPKNLGEEYRWNVPVITYGFDRGFIDYFGLLGVEAVEEAMKMLNDLPAATEMDLAVFPLDSRRMNYRANVQNLMDLKSAAFALVVQQLGLAAPERWVWALAGREVRFNSEDVGWTNYTVVPLNFDPETWLSSVYVNNTRFSYRVLEFAEPSFADAVEFNIQDPGQFPATSVAGADGNIFDSPLEPGIFFSGLTKDDAGGLRYLLHPANINLEPLPEGTAPGGEGTTLVNEAVRPGRNRLRFEPLPSEWAQTPGWSHTVTWTDRYIDGPEIREQVVKRTRTTPDILFSAADLGPVAPGLLVPKRYTVTTPRYRKTSGLEAPGPGIMQPGVVITFGTLGLTRVNTFPGQTSEEQVSFEMPRWGSFDAWGTNAPIAYPLGFTGLLTAKLRMEVDEVEGERVLRMSMEGTPYITYVLQQSADLRSWEDVETIQTETGRYVLERPAESGVRMFYRTASRTQ